MNIYYYELHNACVYKRAKALEKWTIDGHEYFYSKTNRRKKWSLLFKETSRWIGRTAFVYTGTMHRLTDGETGALVTYGPNREALLWDLINLMGEIEIGRAGVIRLHGRAPGYTDHPKHTTWERWKRHDDHGNDARSLRNGC